MDLNEFENRALRRIFFGEQWQDTGRNRIVRRLIICSLHHILLG
jgi:hypothetical protein